MTPSYQQKSVFALSEKTNFSPFNNIKDALIADEGNREYTHRMCERLGILDPILSLQIAAPLKLEMGKKTASTFLDTLDCIGRQNGGVRVKKHLQRHPSEKDATGEWMAKIRAHLFAK